ncbi:hypothetical protein AAHB65_27740 [Bacillus toyonensis]
MGEHVKNHGGKGTKQKYKSEEAKQNSLANLKKNGEYGKNLSNMESTQRSSAESWTLGGASLCAMI